MPDANTEEARKAYLKQLFGGELDASESTLVAPLEGTEYAREARELKELLSEVATVTPKPVYPKEMARRLEEVVRQRSRRALRLSQWATAGMSMVLAFFLVAFCVHPSWEVVRNAVLVCGMLSMTLLGIRLNRAQLENPALFDTLLQSRRAAREPHVILWSWGLALTAMGACCVLLYAYDGLSGVALSIVAFVLLYLIIQTPDRRLRRKHSELWAWWEKQA